MDKKQSIALYEQGKTAWNEWANGMLAEKKSLQETGKWEAEKERWQSEATVTFCNYTFTEETNFKGFIFPGLANFNMTQSLDYARFDLAEFYDRSLFVNTEFFSNSSFYNTKFLRSAEFNLATFFKEVDFQKALFSNDAIFNNAVFHKHSKFYNIIFNGSVSFGDSKFIANPKEPGSIAYVADFSAINCSGHFSLYDTKFEQVPAFTQAHFLEAPSMDRIVIGPEARENPTPPLSQSPSPHGEPVEPREGGETQAAILQQAQDEKEKQAQDEVVSQAKEMIPRPQDRRYEESRVKEEARQIPARWRHLRRMATQGQDHENEQNFFAEELKSRRGVFDFPCLCKKSWPRYWAGKLYEWLSDFGRSIWRPLWIWLSATLAYAFTLLATHDFIANNRPPFELGPNGCLLGDSTPWFIALKTAFDNAIFLPQFGVSNAQAQENLCLFGYDIGLKMPNLPPVPLVPGWITGLGFAHALFSLVMVFLILLAIRNQFRIR